MCNLPAIIRTGGHVMGFDISVIGVACTKSALQIGLTPAMMDALIAPPYNFTELASPSMIYIGSSTLHFMHNEFSRSYADLRDYLASGAFEWKLKYGLKAIKDYAPASSKIAYFNVHTICDEKLEEDDLRARALACAAGDDDGCYGCEGEVPDEFGVLRCAPIAEEDKDNFKHTLMSAQAAIALAGREKRALQAVPELKDVKLVDGHRITEELGCDHTEDGRHYEAAPAVEVEALLDLI